MEFPLKKRTWPTYLLRFRIGKRWLSCPHSGNIPQFLTAFFCFGTAFSYFWGPWRMRLGHCLPGLYLGWRKKQQLWNLEILVQHISSCWRRELTESKFVWRALPRTSPSPAVCPEARIGSLWNVSFAHCPSHPIFLPLLVSTAFLSYFS